MWRTEAHGRDLRVPLHARLPPAVHASCRLRYDTLLAGPEAGRGRRLRRPDLPDLGASPAGWARPSWAPPSWSSIPTYTSRLSFAFLPALFGHAFDLALLCWLAGHLDAVREPRVVAGRRGLGGRLPARVRLRRDEHGGSSCWPWSLVALARRRPRGCGRAGACHGAGRRRASRWRSTTATSWGWSSTSSRGWRRAARRPPRGTRCSRFLGVAYERTRDFFDTVYPILAAAGLVALCAIAAAAGGAPRPLDGYAALASPGLAGRLRAAAGRPRPRARRLPARPRDAPRHPARVPGRRRGALDGWRATVACRLVGGGRGSWPSWPLQGVHGQWRALADQLGNAR